MSVFLDYYVYVLFRENETPFYVGMGRGGRWTYHETHLKGNSHKNNIIKDLFSKGLLVNKLKLVEGLSRTQAHEVERVMVQLIGRRPIGPLVNLTAGGDGGQDPSPEVREKLVVAAKKRAHLTAQNNRERVWTPEMRAKTSKSVSATMTTEHRALLSGKSRAASTPELRAETGRKVAVALSKPGATAGIAEANRNRVWKPETLALIGEQTAERNRKRVWTPEQRAKVGARSKGNQYARKRPVELLQ